MSAASGIEDAIQMLEGRWKLVILFHLFGGKFHLFGGKKLHTARLGAITRVLRVLLRASPIPSRSDR